MWAFRNGGKGVSEKGRFTRRCLRGEVVLEGPDGGGEEDEDANVLFARVVRVDEVLGAGRGEGRRRGARRDARGEAAAEEGAGEDRESPRERHF